MSKQRAGKTYGNILIDDKSYKLKNAPFNDEKAKYYSVLYAEYDCFMGFSDSVFSAFSYILENRKLYVDAVSCMYKELSENELMHKDKKIVLDIGEEILPRIKITPFKHKDIYYEIFKQKEKLLVSWFSGELHVVNNLNISGDKNWIYDYELLVLKIENGVIIDSYEKEERVYGLKKFKTYICE